ncbi:MAG: YceI family protein [Planctomycetota bacterium]|nr:YceI family protein [Planctomycetota bacterium]
MNKTQRVSRSMLALSTTALLVLAMVTGGLARQDDSPTPTTSDGPVTWKVDSVHSTALFRVTHLGAGAFWGRFNEPTGEIVWDRAGEACPEFDIKIPVKSVDSGNGKLDDHLRSMDFFNESEYPDMTFKSTGCTPNGENRWDMSGDLTLLGQTKPVTVKLEMVGQADMGRGLRSGFEATFSIKRSDHGMSWGVNRGALGDTVKVIVSLEVIKQ